MAKPAELANYTSEDDFVQRFLIPLLFRLGYSVIANYHGTQEHGKDLVFGDIDRFGHVVFYGLQAKYEDSMGKSRAIEVREDIEAALANKFKHPSTGALGSISRFYYVNAGSLSAEMLEDVRARIANVDQHCVFMDGKALVALDRWATLSRNNLVKEMLSGLLLEIRWNRFIGVKLAETVQETNPAAFHIVQYRLAAVLAYLERPILIRPDFPLLIQAYYNIAIQTNYIYQSADVSISAGTWRQDRLRACVPLIGELNEGAGHIESIILDTLARLGNET